MPNPNHENNSTEENWKQTLEQNRLRGLKMSQPGLNLPGPGATSAVAGGKKAFSGVKIPQTLGGKNENFNQFGQMKAPSSAETVKTMARAATAAGLTKQLQEEATDLAKAAGKGISAMIEAQKQVIMKYLPLLLMFSAVGATGVEPFFTSIIIITALWCWVIGAHVLHVKWLRQFNIVELMLLVDISLIFFFQYLLYFIIVAAIVGGIYTVSTII